MVDGRNDWESELKKNTTTGPKVWFHCASLGEFEQGRPLLEQMKRDHPEYGIFITFFSPSGYEAMKNYDLADYIFYLPFDSSINAKKFIELLKPSMAIFIKYEFWHYYLLELKKRKIPTFSVSAIFRSDQQFFKKRSHFFRNMLMGFEHFFVQNETSRQLLNSHGFDNVSVSGDTRFDRVKEICSNPHAIEIAALFKSSEKVMVIGSSWPDDIEVLLPYINDKKNRIKFIIAPHEVGKEKIKKLVKGIAVKYQIYSKADPNTIHSAKVLIINNIGMLSSLYQYGEIAYIGGAFGEGLHNILEAATFGLPIIFGKGKDNNKYQEAVDLLRLGGAFEISDSQELKTTMDGMLDDHMKLESASKICSDYVNNNSGATKKIMTFLDNYLD